ncbi:uncharacterized protein LOC121056120 [Oryza brachyantha]|uniref:uncharacterized protein LOC121056120 n=1 Tax=Oryza brachyantha TaxID=4533 RepID=UPI001ADB8B3C|nr:uncharacterized protein LOC121056120 [Oryza brachyantha]
MSRRRTRSHDQDSPEGSRRNQEGSPPPPTMAEVLMAVERNREAQNTVLQQIAASAAAVAAQIARSAGGGGHQVAGGLAEFQRTQPPVFTRSDDPLDADDWLRTIERKLTLIRCPDAEKTNLAAEQLQGAAGDWWENFLAMQPAGHAITWPEFRNAFRAAHVPKGIMDLKQREFLSLTQGNKSVMEYLREFNHLARYAPDDVNTDARKQNRFMNGLSAEMQLELAAHSFLDFQDLVNRSVVVESKMNNLENERKRKRAAQISAAGGSQKPRGWQQPPPRYQAPPPPRRQGFVPRPPQQRVTLPVGGNQQAVRPPVRSNNCFNCGQAGHYINQCPYPRRAQEQGPRAAAPRPNPSPRAAPQGQQNQKRGRVNHVTAEEANNAPDVLVDLENPESTEPYPEEDSDYPQQEGEDSGYELCFLCGHCSAGGGEGSE